MSGMHATCDDHLPVPFTVHPTEFLTFTLGSEEYAIDILHVREIRSYSPPTSIVNAPPFVPGLISLRGSIVPLLDLRLKFGASPAEITPFTVVIIVSVASHLVGIIVDGVSDVILLRPDEVRPAADLAIAARDSSIEGICLLDERMLIVIDIEHLVASTATRMKS